MVRSWVTSEAYSSPSIVLISGHGPHRVVLDDFREAYYWLRHNTKPDAKIMSWCASLSQQAPLPLSSYPYLAVGGGAHLSGLCRPRSPCYPHALVAHAWWRPG